MNKLFEGHSPIVKIDGWTNPCDGTRFCLGIITNISRTREIELVRRSIGNGISLIYEQGTISLKNTSESSIFVQSEQMNILWHLKQKECLWDSKVYSRDHKKTVMRVGVNLTFFNISYGYFQAWNSGWSKYRPVTKQIFSATKDSCNNSLNVMDSRPFTD